MKLTTTTKIREFMWDKIPETNEKANWFKCQQCNSKHDVKWTDSGLWCKSCWVNAKQCKRCNEPVMRCNNDDYMYNDMYCRNCVMPNKLSEEERKDALDPIKESSIAGFENEENCTGLHGMARAENRKKLTKIMLKMGLRKIAFSNRKRKIKESKLMEKLQKKDTEQ